MSARSERALIASIAAHQSWANTTDRSKRTTPARRGFLARFEREVDPDGVLPPEERQRRAESALRAHMRRLALRSSRARRRASLGLRRPQPDAPNFRGPNRDADDTRPGHSPRHGDGLQATGGRQADLRSVCRSSRPGSIGPARWGIKAGHC